MRYHWRKTLLFVTALNAASFVLRQPVDAQETTRQELDDLKALVRQQALAMQALQKRIDTLAPRLHAPQTKLATAPSGQQGAAKPAPEQQAAAAAPAGPATGSYELAAPPGFTPITVGPVGKVPGPLDKNVVVTQQPGNLPGRSAVPPFTAANIGNPGGVAPVPATPVSSGAGLVRLSLSGQIDRALLYGNDGVSSAVRNVDNNNSSTRFRIVGEGQVSPTFSGGINSEVEVRPNSSANTTLTQNLPQPASTVTPTIRQAEVYFQDTRYGSVRLGFGSVASYLTSEVDLSGTAVASYVNVADADGGFAFRQRGNARVPTAGNVLVASPSGSFGPAVGAEFFYFDGLVRENRIRYDTPVWNGVQGSVDYTDGGAIDVGVRYAGIFDGNQIVAGFGFVDAIARRHLTLAPVSGFPGAAANLYGYAGVPTGANGTATLGTAVTPATGDASANGSYQYDASASLLLKNGLNFTVAGGYRDVNYLDPTGRKLSPTLLFGKVGYRANLFDDVGISAISFDYTQNIALQFAGDHARSYSAALVQNIDAAAAELFLEGRVQTLRRTFADYDQLVAVELGSRVRF